MIYIASLYILYIPKLYLCFHLTSCFWPLSELLTAIPFIMHQLLIFFDSCCCCLDTKQRWRKNCFGHANRPVQWTKSNIGSRRSRKSCPQFSFGDAWSGTCGTCKFSALQCFGDMSCRHVVSQRASIATAQLCEAARTIPIFTSNRTGTPFLWHKNYTARHVSGRTEIGLTLRKARDSLE